jgi:hypothetical protein
MEKMKNKNLFIDGLGGRRRQSLVLDFPLSRYILKHKKSSVLLGPGGQTENFFTDDSGLYFTPAELKIIRRKERIARIIKRLDSLNARSFEKTKIYATVPVRGFDLRLQRRYAQFRETALNLINDSFQKVTLVKMWNLSIVGAVIFGMFTMTMIYKYLGQSVSAEIRDSRAIKEAGAVLGAADKNYPEVEVDTKYITLLLEKGDITQSEFEKEVREMVRGYPIEEMVPEIIKKDRIVAAFIISIAKQESNWGKRVPVLNGEDCFNYWGYRGQRARMGTGGHTCFDSIEDAVNTVGKRIEFLVSNNKLNTPEKMIIWKCGDCSWDNQRDMQRWINAVNMYFQKLND